MIKNWIFVCYDQLSWENSLLKDSDPKSTGLLFIETSSKPRRRPYHKQKLVFILSAMRHFAKEAQARGYTVHYHHNDTGYAAGLEELRKEYSIPMIQTLEIQEWEVASEFLGKGWIKFSENNLFLSTRAEFDHVFENTKGYLQETFYRFMRRKLGILLDEDGKPLGGKWNLDHENRSNWKDSDPIPNSPPWIQPDKMTQNVIQLVEQKFPESFGSLENFGWPVTRESALEWLEHFVRYKLEYFGKYEDAMSPEEPYLFHSLLSPLIHVGLLHPKEVVERALQEYEIRKFNSYNDKSETKDFAISRSSKKSQQKLSKIPLSSIEGFVRQIIGWREYMRHIYQKNREHFKKANFFQHTKALPSMYWGKPSGMKCIDSVVKTVVERGYSHHITRLMVLSNFANLLGVDPQKLNEWFWFAYVDAYEWVVTPNVVGMGTYADGGMSATKPYVASANYIRKMAPGFCRSCSYDPSGLLEENACPFNALYWNFIAENEKYYSRPGRRDFSWKNWIQFPEDRKKAIQRKAKQLRKRFLDL